MFATCSEPEGSLRPNVASACRVLCPVVFLFQMLSQNLKLDDDHDGNCDSQRSVITCIFNVLPAVSVLAIATMLVASISSIFRFWVTSSSCRRHMQL
ncbi:hypothetical protein ACLKA7_013630 [Drosophila subpalustris]